MTDTDDGTLFPPSAIDYNWTENKTLYGSGYKSNSYLSFLGKGKSTHVVTRLGHVFTNHAKWTLRFINNS